MYTYSGKKIGSILLAVVIALHFVAITSWGIAAEAGESGEDVGSGYSAGAMGVGFSITTRAAAPVKVTTFEELQKAIDEAVSGAVIDIQNNIQFEEAITISSDKTIAFCATEGEASLKIGGYFRHFIIQPGTEVALSFQDISLDGDGKNGGIVNNGSLELNGVIIKNCRGIGAGVKNQHDLLLRDSLITNNSTSTTVSASGIYNDSTGTVIMENTFVTGNNAGFDAGGVYNLGTFTMTDSGITGNTGRYGAGVRNHGLFTMERSEISENKAEMGGGGVFNCETATLHIIESEISNNAALGTNVATQSGGGGILNQGTVVIEDSELSGNTTKAQGGGICVIGLNNRRPTPDSISVTISNSSLKNNSAAVNGGAIMINREREPSKTAYGIVGYDKLTIDENVIFEGNTTATPVTIVNERDIAIHNRFIKATQFSSGFQYGYNNYDINYTPGDPASSLYTVSFDSKGGTPEPEDQIVGSGGYAVEPDDVKQLGYILEGWYREDTGDRWDFTDLVTEDMTLVANWEIKTYIVIFDADGGSPGPEVQKVSYGGKAAEPSQPSRGDDIFLGWYTEDGAEWHFQQHTVTENLKLVAHWKAPDVPDPIKYTVTFDAAGGAPIPADQTVLEGGKAVKPVQPSKEGYIFDGWYSGTAVWDFDKNTVNINIALIARWTEKPTEPITPPPPAVTEYTVRFDTDGGTPVPQNQSVEKGEKAASPAENPSKSGYSFTGWYHEGSIWNFDEDTVEGNMMLTAGWKANESSGGSDKDSGSNKPDDLDGNTDGEAPGGTTGGSGGSGSRDRGSTVSVGRDVYINDQDIPLANELLSIFEEEVPLAEINLFDIPDTGAARGFGGLIAGGTLFLAILAYKRED